MDMANTQMYIASASKWLFGAYVAEVRAGVLLFGTFYMPPGRQPESFVVLHYDIPQDLLGQLWYPFQSRRRSIHHPTKSGDLP